MSQTSLVVVNCMDIRQKAYILPKPSSL